MSTPVKTTNTDLSERHSVITDEPLTHLIQWSEAGERVALITLIGVDGAAPRAPGAQMVVSHTGKAAGYLSGGCLEQALILEAISAMDEGKNRLLRYGKGSPFIDIRLPCESGLDIYIDQAITPHCIAEMATFLRARKPFVLKTEFAGETSAVLPAVPPADLAPLQRTDTHFIRAYQPQTKVMLFGAGPTAERIAALAAASGLALEIFSPEEALKNAAREHEAVFHPLTKLVALPTIEADRWSACVLAFHDHDCEVPLLTSILRSDAFYIGAIGNRKVAEERVAWLRALGLTEKQLARLNSPAGLIKGAKSANALALGILTEILAAAG